MTNTILLTQPAIGVFNRKWFFAGMGVANLVIGIIQLSNEWQSSLSLFFSTLLVLAGIFGLISSMILFSSTSRFTPKVELDDNNIYIREDLFKTRKRLRWAEIIEITFKSFAMEFRFKNSDKQLIILRTDAETSHQIKQAIRSAAYYRNIQVNL